MNQQRCDTATVRLLCVVAAGEQADDVHCRPISKTLREIACKGASAWDNFVYAGGDEWLRHIADSIDEVLKDALAENGQAMCSKCGDVYPIHALNEGHACDACVGDFDSTCRQ